MSTILDALKKSEQERKLNNVPTLSDMPTPQETKSWPTVLLFVVIFLLVMLILVLIFKGDSGDRSLTQTGLTELQSVQANKPASDSDIVVNVVSYSEQADQSFVMIDGKLFRQGEFVRAGLKVEKIKFDEVVLNLRGRKITRKP